jgi:hypothetical protein
MAFFNAVQPDKVIVVAALCILAVGLIGAVVAVLTTLKKYKYTTKTERKKMEGSDEIVSADDYQEEILMQGDNFVLVRNVVYKVGDDGQLAAGSYLLRSAIEGESAFDVLYNGNPINMQDGATVNLGEGDSIACVTGSMLIIKQ